MSVGAALHAGPKRDDMQAQWIGGCIVSLVPRAGRQAAATPGDLQSSLCLPFLVVYHHCACLSLLFLPFPGGQITPGSRDGIGLRQWWCFGSDPHPTGLAVVVSEPPSSASSVAPCWSCGQAGRAR